MEKLFNKEYLGKKFEGIGKRLAKRTPAYVLGGGVMCFRGQKTGTKDLDIVFVESAPADDFCKAAKKEGFEAVKRLESPYQLMDAHAVLENVDEFRLDVFSGKVCGKLALSKTMRLRAERFGSFGNLDVFLVSNEDVILFKAVTERARDADDIAAVIRLSRVDWNIIVEECKEQSKGVSWHGMLHNKLIEIQERHNITSPIIKEVAAYNERDILEAKYAQLQRGGMGKKEALAELKKRGFSKKELAGLDK